MHSIYKMVFDVTLSKNETFVNYQVNADIRTLDLGKLDKDELGEELDEDAIEEIMDSFKMLFSSRIVKGSVQVADNDVPVYMRTFGFEGFDFSF